MLIIPIVLTGICIACMTRPLKGDANDMIFRAGWIGVIIAVWLLYAACLGWINELART